MAELLALGKAINPKFTVEKCQQLMKQMDTNHDGKVSVEEFVELVGLWDGRSEAYIKRMRGAALSVSAEGSRLKA